MKNFVNSLKTLSPALIIALALLFSGCGKKEASTPEKNAETKTSEVKESDHKTLENLMEAYNGESNANERYTEFAKKAEQEGYLAIAKLFRAAAASEKIHADNHAVVITKMGGNPKADIKPVELKTTKENLETAITGETYEHQTMYPKFIEIAKTDQNKDAIRTFNMAMEVEVGHDKLYKEALGNMNNMKIASIDFYVCSICGNTVKALTFEKCPVCFQSKSKYSKIS